MKRLFLSILLCIFVWGMKAQEMDAVFVAMPDQYVPQLENAWRKDLIDLYNSGKEERLFYLEEADGRLPVVAGDGAQHGRDEALASGQ